MEWLIGRFATVEHSAFYLVVLVFFGSYPVVSSLIWVTTGVLFYLRRERRQPEGFFAGRP